ncbi:hypothetical protein [Providencia sp. Je.9.19]|uniref:hypothetical protein n=1 Tax=Providencia sp. Je.9.19 TaxID=3142844 RepID=UPI003DA98186
MKWKLRFGAALGNTLEYYDIAVFAAISIYLSAELERLGYVQATEMICITIFNSTNRWVCDRSLCR